ncbi:MAG: quaternary ammonium transporter [Candidatus Eremiobacteraeota bacterium]|nr:quaternary ammonium transporter [Candidatus Eremiobacteraeota bacterium]
MSMTRAQLLAGMAATLTLPRCAARKSNAIRIGSKDFTEELIIAEVYAQAIEAHALPVERKLNLGSTQIAMAALLKGEIDLYPEYTGTALLDVLKLPVMHEPASIYSTVAKEYERRYDLRWLKPAPMNDSQGLATTAGISKRYGIQTLSELSKAAPLLRLGAIPEFVRRPDALPGLQRYYGGFRFKDVKLFDIGLKYKALLSGQVDVVPAFTTEGLLETNHLVLFKDDRRFWPAYQVAPVVRQAALAKYPQIAAILNSLAPFFTDETMRRLNYEVDGRKQEPADVAAQFLKSHNISQHGGSAR